jgi:dienelactone hydrolase
MADETYTSAKDTYTIKVYPGPADGKKHPMILVVHGNAGLNSPSVSRFTASPRSSPRRVM